MNQADITVFVASADTGTLTPEGVTAALAAGITVNGRDKFGDTALHYAVWHKRRALVAALLSAGADANVKNSGGGTSVLWCANNGPADTLQMLIDGGGRVNEPGNTGMTPLIALVRNNNNDASARLGVLLTRPELDLDARFEGRTAENWAEKTGHLELAAAIRTERERRQRWGALRSAWVGMLFAHILSP